MTTDHAPKKFRLSFINAAEDVPRLVRAYGRCCGGELALVMRPTEGRAALVHVGKKESFFWRSGGGASDGRHRVPAKVVRADHGSMRLSPTTPGSGGTTWGISNPEGLVVGEVVTMAFSDGEQFAEVVRDSAVTDAPGKPLNPVSARDAVTLIKTERKAMPKPGPITLRGQWSGSLVCDGGDPTVTITRKLATYGVLTITSRAGTGWRWSVARTEKWFSKPGSDDGHAPTMLKAIEAGLARAMGLLGEACSARDSRRRAALDTSWAAEHPIRPAIEGKDPVERLKEKEPRKGRSTVAEPVEEAAAPILTRSSMADEGLQPGDRAVLASDPSRVGTVVEWRGEDRIVWQEDGKMIRAVFHPSRLAPVVDEPPPEPPKPRAARKPRQDKAALPPRRGVTQPPPQAEPQVDAAKDAALMSALSAVVKEAFAT